MNDKADIQNTPPPEAPPEDDDSGRTELLAGVMFVAIGALALFIGHDYPMGTALDMGPGYIPRIVAIALIGMGAIGVVRGFIRYGGEWPTIPIRSLLWIAGAIIAFSWLIGRAGLFLTAIVVVLMACMAAPQIRWREIPFIVLALAVFSTLLFGYALRLPLPVWPQ